MSLGDILVELLGEALGIPVKKTQQQQGRRPPPPPVPEPEYTSETRPPARGLFDFDELFDDLPPESREIFSRLTEEEEAFADGEPRVQEIARAAEPFRPTSVIESVPATGAESFAPISAGLQHERRQDMPPELPKDFVERLRNDPEAARAGFVYGEIFGPPLAERREW